MAERETWESRLGFILAAVGSAVGLGNIWGFPFQAGQNGGAAFLVVYLAVVFLIGFPAILMEFVVGRRSRRNPIDAFRELGHGAWAVAGIVGTFTAFWILSFYSVIGGWVLRYLGGSVTGAYFGDATRYFNAVATGPEAVALHAVFMLLVIGIVAFGVEDGIERSAKVMVPSIVVLLLGLGVWASTLANAGAGYKYYLSPDVDVIVNNIASILPSAVGQAFFTLSLGMGAMIAYSSYLGRDDSLPRDGGIIVIFNTLVGLLAGFVVFPILFNLGIEPGSGGSGTAFKTLGGAFGQIPSGELVGVVFFFVLLLAALSSAISLLEVVTSFAVENTSYSRPTVAVGVGSLVFLLGVPSALYSDYLMWFNLLAYDLFLPAAVLLLALFIGWVYPSGAVDELTQGSGVGATFNTVWLWFVRIVIPAGILLTLVLGVQELLVVGGVLESAVFLG